MAWHVMMVARHSRFEAVSLFLRDLLVVRDVVLAVA